MEKNILSEFKLATFQLRVQPYQPSFPDPLDLLHLLELMKILHNLGIYSGEKT